MKKEKEFLIENIDGQLICLKGIGKLFYQEGFPIPIAIQKFKEKGIKVSILHIADECMKNGWSSKTTISKLSEDFIDSRFEYPKELLIKFCDSSYEEQREIIFNYLFGNIDKAKEFFNNKFT